MSICENEGCGPDCGGCAVCIPHGYRNKLDLCQCDFGNCQCNQPKISLDDQITRKIGSLYGMGQSEKHKNLDELLGFVLCALDIAANDKLDRMRYRQLRAMVARKAVEACPVLSQHAIELSIDAQVDQEMGPVCI